MEGRTALRRHWLGKLPTARLSTRPNTLFKAALHVTKSGQDTMSAVNVEGNVPRNQCQFHSYVDLPRRFDLDTSVYFVGWLDAQGVSSYTRLDTQIGRRAAESVELSVNGQNLLDNHHLEFNGVPQAVASTEVKRSAYGKLT
jgi:hypothetical protein